MGWLPYASYATIVQISETVHYVISQNLSRRALNNFIDLKVFIFRLVLVLIVYETKVVYIIRQ